MAKYYVELGRGQVRLVLNAGTAEQAAVKAFQRASQRQAAVYSESPSEVIRDAEAVQ
jgi:cellobiose-specific phosphotransferase system component IIA